MSRNTIWTTKSVEETILKVRMGHANLDLSCFYMGNLDLKASNVRFQLTLEEEQEFLRCSEDIEYFVEKYCKFQTDKGYETVELRDFQNEIIQTLGEEEWKEDMEMFGSKVRNYILMASRQTGKTTTISAYFAWYLCFHNDRNMAILANKQATTSEIVRKVTMVFKGLPFFLKPGIENIQVLGLRLDNGCMVTSQATSATSSLGFTIHVLYIDEFAHIRPHITGEFWRSVYPTLASSKISQCIISSTPNGMDNLFFDIWDKANRGKNSFVYKRVDWWEVPEHDDAWAEQMKADFGEEEFAQEFELKFDVTSNNLLTGSQLNWIKRLSSLQGKYEFQEMVRTSLDSELYENLKFRKDFDINKNFNQKTDRFLISIDLAEGKDEDELKDSDYSVAGIWQVKLKSLAKLKKLRSDELQIENMFRIEQVGLYRDNVKDEEVLAKVCQSLVFDQINKNSDETMVKIILEMNFNGKAFLHVFRNHEDFFEALVMRSWHTAPVPGQKPPRKKAGFKVRSDKDHYCKAAKKRIGRMTILPNEENTYAEFAAFGRVKKRWKGIGKHDDTVMQTVNIARIFDEPEYTDWLYDFLVDLPPSKAKSFALKAIQEPNPDDEREISDELWKAMYDPAQGELDRLNEILQNERSTPYKPYAGM